MTEGYSLSDLAAVTNEGGLGGNSAWILIILFFLVFGGNNWGRNGEFGQFATAASQSEILLGQQFQGLDNKIDRIGNGIADLGYALTNNIHASQDVVAGAVVNEGRTTQNMLSAYQLDSQKNVDALRYDMSNFACAINQNIDNKFAALEKAQLEQTIAAQANQINQLALAQQMAGVVKYPMASTYAMLNNPFCSCGNGCCN